MKKINVWGCSDDLIEVTGDAEAEFYGEGGKFLLSDGSIFEIEYSYDGNWKCRPIDVKEGIEWHIHRMNSEYAKDVTDRDYSEVLEITGDFSWFTLSQEIYEL